MLIEYCGRSLTVAILRSWTHSSNVLVQAEIDRGGVSSLAGDVRGHSALEKRSVGVLSFVERLILHFEYSITTT